MAILPMLKVKIVGLLYNKESILNAIQKTGLVEIKATEELEDTQILEDGILKQELLTKYDRINRCIEFIEKNLELSKNEDYHPGNLEELKTFSVSYDEFISASDNEAETFCAIEKTEEYAKRLLDSKSNVIKLKNLQTQIEPYLPLKDKFSDFKDTESVAICLGLISTEGLSKLKKELPNYPFTSIKETPTTSGIILSVASLKEEFESFSQKLNECGFVKCSFDFDLTATQKTEEIIKEIDKFKKQDSKTIKESVAFYSSLRNLKVLSDYYRFQIEKQNVSDNFRCTKQTFTLEGYLPKEGKEELSNTLYQTTSAIFIDFSEPTKEDNPPTLLKNNKLSSQAEFVTNMYSPPDYREVDPNGAVFFFFMVFFGLIMADIGYGIVLMLVGLLFKSTIKIENGTKKLIRIIITGGFFTILFGLLFGSLFGVSLYSIVPDPTSGVRSDILIILLACLLLGLIQVAVGYCLQAANAFKQKRYLDGILDSLLWVVFFVGLLCAVFNFLMNYFNIPVAPWLTNFFDKLELPGLITLGVSLLIIVVTAGRHEKGFGKLTKGFGSLYGIINLFSDILSYARLFGLMLSGMIIAQQFNQMGLDLIAGGVVGYALGPIVMLVGHVFNLAMGVLGAYIHVSRLQYIEFFSKFYKGEGELFAPLGSEFNYIHLKK